MYDDTPDTDCVGGMRDAHRRITKEGSAKSLTLPGSIDGQSTEQDNRDRIRHVAPELARHTGYGHGS